jgi:hypothetical protein
LEDLHAVTHASLIAKAVVLPAIIRDCADEGEPKCRFALSLVRELVGPDAVPAAA